MTATRQKEKDAMLSPIAFSIEDANKEINSAEQELAEGAGVTETEMKHFFKNIRVRLSDKGKTPRPCVINSQEEMIAAITESEKEIERGGYITNEDMEKEIESWFKEDI